MDNQTILKRMLMVGLAISAMASTSAAQAIRARVDGDLVRFPEAQPMMVNDRVMVPVRGVFEHMGADVMWNQEDQTVVAQRGQDLIELKLNSRFASVNGNRIPIDSPAVMRQGSMMVPLRFISESLGAKVQWVIQTQTVEIDTNGTPPRTADPNESSTGYTTIRLPVGTVIPFRLNERLQSNVSKVGDKFTASLDSDDGNGYQGIPVEALLEGHVDVARAKVGNTPGVLGLKFDRIRLNQDRVVPIYGKLIGIDQNSITNKNGRWVAKPAAANDNLKYVGYGAGAGALVSILTGKNLLTTSLIGAALGLLGGEIAKDPSQARNVNSEPGTKFGVRLTRELRIRVPTATNLR